jgi:hypothetical protein
MFKILNPYSNKQISPIFSLPLFSSSFDRFALFTHLSLDKPLFLRMIRWEALNSKKEFVPTQKFCKEWVSIS